MRQLYPIKDLDISVSAYNFCRANAINYLNEFSLHNIVALKKFKHASPRIIGEISEEMQSHGIEFSRPAKSLKITMAILFLFLTSIFSCKTVYPVYHVGDILIYNDSDSVIVIKEEVGLDKKPLYEVALFNHRDWKLHVNPVFLKSTTK